MSRFALTALAAAASAVLLMGVSPGPQPPEDNKQLAHDIFKQLVEIHSSDTIGTKEIADAITARLLGGGFTKADIHVLPEEKYPNQVSVVVRYHGKGKGKPILWNCHIDIVDARPEDWTLPPFKFTEKDGYFYGRGTSDMKDQDAAVLATLLRLKKEGFVPDRDIIVAFTADEEGDWAQDGMRYLMAEHRDLVDAGMAINPDGDSGEIINNQRVDYGVETSQKTYVTYTLTETNKGGHSSEPRPDNAIYELAERARALFEIPIPVQDQCDDAALFRTHGVAADRSTQGGLSRHGEAAPRSRSRATPVRRYPAQRDPAFDLRRHHAERGRAGERAAGARRRHHSMPHHAG